MPRTIDQIEESDSSKEVLVNEQFVAALPALGFGKRYSTSVGLTLEIYGGVILIAGTPTVIGNYTATLTATSFNYVVMHDDGTFDVYTSAPSGWPGPLAGGDTAILDCETDTGGIIDGSLNDWRISPGGGVTLSSVLSVLGIDSWTITGTGPYVLTITKGAYSTVLDLT